MKKFASLALAGALAFSLAAPALAVETPVLISAKLPTFTVNGVKLDTSKLPAADGVPLRAFVEADGGSATWYAEENLSQFFTDDTVVSVDFATGKVEVDRKEVSGVKAEAVEGVTYVPVEVIKAMSGVVVTVDGSDYTITTPSSDPLVKLAKSVQEATEMGRGMKVTGDQLKDFAGIEKDNYSAVVAYTPMMINADTLIIGKVASGKMDAVKTELEAKRAQIQSGFENYLPGPLEMAKNGKVVTSGDYAMLIISPDNDAAIELFNAYVKSL